MEKYWGKDPRAVVIDEFFGTWGFVMSVLFFSGSPYLFITLSAIAFILFRIIDITKPLGCRWIDKNIHGGIGCMLDDALAGFYAFIATLMIRLLVTSLNVFGKYAKLYFCRAFSVQCRVNGC